MCRCKRIKLLVNEGMELFNQGRTDQALANLRQAMRAAEGHSKPGARAALNNNFGQILASMGRTREAREQFDTALSVLDRNLLGHTPLAVKIRRNRSKLMVKAA